jgi:hypothetical protein
LDDQSKFYWCFCFCSYSRIQFMGWLHVIVLWLWHLMKICRWPGLMGHRFSFCGTNTVSCTCICMWQFFICMPGCNQSSQQILCTTPEGDHPGPTLQLHRHQLLWSTVAKILECLPYYSNVEVTDFWIWLVG